MGEQFVFWMTVAHVGSNGVTKIKAYGEPGEYGYVPFIAVYKGEDIVLRRPALTLTIFYEERAGVRSVHAASAHCR